jgi:hypothetical protein
MPKQVTLSSDAVNDRECQISTRRARKKAELRKTADRRWVIGERAAEPLAMLFGRLL